MPLFEWSKQYSVGVTAMDQHHQKLFEILNRLHDAMRQGKGRDLIQQTLAELLDYTRYHFGEEEKLMQQAQYIGLPAQRKAHATFISQIQEYQAQAEQGMAAFLSSGVAAFLTDWLKNHVAIMDKQYTETLNARGIR